MPQSMVNYWKSRWRQLFASDLKESTEVAQIGVLQQVAARRRAEYAEELERSTQTGENSRPGLLPAHRKRMADAEAAHTAALQTWENKQSRQKSR